MKKFFKAIGPAVGYFIIYFVINIIVLFIGSLYLVIKAEVLAMTNPSLVETIPDIAEALKGSNIMLFSSVASIIFLFVCWLIILCTNTPLKERLELNPVSFRSFWPVIALGITLNIFISQFLGSLPIPENVFNEYAQATSLLGNEITLVQILSVVIVAPIVEEILYRGLIMKSLQIGMPVVIALIIQALIFGLMHGQLLWICYATFLGVLLAIIRLRYKSLYPSILLHMSFNAANYILIPLYYLIPDNVFSNVILITVALIISVFLGIVIFKKTNNTLYANNISAENSGEFPNQETPEICLKE
ncbi:MAG: CPBP family intramembrane glutamic endopeptidase [Acetivibrionales bacterium]|nr:CPBP family intramembrane metalloprotease [Clostridiaceae bacterium]